ncbi:hypothetical protein [Pseudotabrizicola alkalilacus]|uniref:Uncharacterized protein n=1 Tax=Pseudotabrizicola alkalilacus TaxID=2305252 RepID=A0A411YXM4_9RHOB|nr:hypothetical protein [Pseudotabrizicola alkalilacus]RGP35631.1 hypothetical protein D1012_18760 [Pseudotabrizicola alkalilacus]
MWKPEIKTWADKFFVGTVGLAGVLLLSIVGRTIWIVTSLNVEKWAEAQGIDDTLVKAWPSMMAWVVDNSLWLWLASMFVLGAASSLLVYRQLAPLDRPNLKDPSRIKKTGTECSDLAQEMLRFLERRAIDNSHRRQQVRAGGAETTSMHSWEADRDFEAVTCAQFFSQYGARALTCLALLDQIGISLPPHIVTLAQHSRPQGLVQVLAVFGEYLKRGELEEAISLSHDKNFMWRIQH